MTKNQLIFACNNGPLSSLRLLKPVQGVIKISFKKGGGAEFRRLTLPNESWLSFGRVRRRPGSAGLRAAPPFNKNLLRLERVLRGALNYNPPKNIPPRYGELLNNKTIISRNAFENYTLLRYAQQPEALDGRKRAVIYKLPALSNGFA